MKKKIKVKIKSIEKGKPLEEKKLKWATSRDGLIRALVTEDQPDVIENVCYRSADMFPKQNFSPTLLTDK